MECQACKLIGLDNRRDYRPIPLCGECSRKIMDDWGTRDVKTRCKGCGEALECELLALCRAHFKMVFPKEKPEAGK